MDLAASRQQAAELSGGTSADTIKNLVIRALQAERAGGSLLDFGAGLGILLRRLHSASGFAELAGTDLFPRPADLPAPIAWFQQDLNDNVNIDRQFDVVVCSETIEHLENPRQTFRSLYRLVKPGGLLVLTMPHQQSIRSYVGLLFGGHFTSFLGASYPAHITALLRMDLQRLCAEAGFTPPRFLYTNEGGIPKLPWLKWQTISFGLLSGPWFSDNVGIVTRRPL